MKCILGIFKLRNDIAVDFIFNLNYTGTKIAEYLDSLPNNGFIDIIL